MELNNFFLIADKEKKQSYLIFLDDLFIFIPVIVFNRICIFLSFLFTDSGYRYNVSSLNKVNNSTVCDR